MNATEHSAWSLHAPGDLREDSRPSPDPKSNEVVVDVCHVGICGSDLHYYRHGGFGAVRVKEPLILGHEVAGRVLATGKDVSELRVGDVVAVDPAKNCQSCGPCLAGETNQCLEIQFLGSARTMPHVQGAMRNRLVVEARQCHKVSGRRSYSEYACAEPLSVCLHAASKAPELAGASVLVTGAGPIGQLLIALVRHLGGARITATDISEMPLTVSKKMGADRALNTSDPTQTPGSSRFDVAFECSAAPAAIRAAVDALRPGGTLILVGVGGDTPMPLDSIVGKEIKLIGSHRFCDEFAHAVKLIESGEIDVRPILTHKVSAVDPVRGFELAMDRSRALKVGVEFSD